MKRGKRNPIIIKTSLKNRVSTGKEDFVKPEEHAHHSHQRDVKYLNTEPAEENKGSGLWFNRT